MVSWQSGNAPDSKSGEPVHTGAQVQILYSPSVMKARTFSRVLAFLCLILMLSKSKSIKFIFVYAYKLIIILQFIKLLLSIKKGVI